MTNAFEVLKERGFIQQVTDEDAVRRTFDEEVVTCYIGFDPTADTLHVGHLVSVMILSHFQRCGHRPIALVGGGTAMIGDPTGRTELRKILTRETIDANVEGLKAQIGRYLDFDGGKALLVNNADWLLDLQYIDFLRDIGRHFSVNRMLAAETYKIRMESGLSFLEFNYQILQAYDFLMLHRLYGCTMQMGGDDQWGNILAGVDLIRRLEGTTTQAVTTPLITNADGQKMGKTAAGAVWLDPAQLSPYDYYQYWINTDDRDVGKFLAYFTFLPMDEVAGFAALEGADLREAKTVLAYEATKITHGEEEAGKAQQAARSAFGSSAEGAGDLPASVVTRESLDSGVGVVELFIMAGLGASKSDIRRLVQQGGAYINGKRVSDVNTVINTGHVEDGALLLRAGKNQSRQRSQLASASPRSDGSRRYNDRTRSAEHVALARLTQEQPVRTSGTRRRHRLVGDWTGVDCNMDGGWYRQRGGNRCMVGRRRTQRERCNCSDDEANSALAVPQQLAPWRGCPRGPYGRHRAPLLHQLGFPRT